MIRALNLHDSTDQLLLQEIVEALLEDDSDYGRGVRQLALALLGQLVEDEELRGVLPETGGIVITQGTTALCTCGWVREASTAAGAQQRAHDHGYATGHDASCA